MSSLRDEIRAILREEIAALRGEIAPTVETVKIDTSSDLNNFVRDIVTRMSDPNFTGQLNSGQIQFALADSSKTALVEQHGMRPIVTSLSKPNGIILDKALVTESDISELDTSVRTVRVANQSCLTPLAKDEARRKGIRIERIET